MPMIEEGIMENPKVNAALGLHIGGIFSELDAGQIGIAYGSIMACLDSFYVKIMGHGSHGAMPHAGTDPIVMAGQVITAIQTIVSREINLQILLLLQ